MASCKSVLNDLGESPARRNLFGPVDHEQLQQEYRDAVNTDLQAACYRWGFDFRSDKPLAQGDVQWEGVPEATVPALYYPSVVSQGEARTVGGLAGSAGRIWVGLWRWGKEDISCTPEKDRGNCHNPEKLDKENKDCNEKRRKQTNLTDFYQAKKRVVDTPRKSGQ